LQDGFFSNKKNPIWVNFERGLRWENVDKFYGYILGLF
jgi:hypothetical protein